MPPGLLPQVFLMFGEGLVVSVVLLLLFRLRRILGLAPIYITVAIFYQLANLTAASVYIKISSDLMLSPGSVVLFPAILIVVLYVYIREDALETRTLIYGLLAGDLVVAVLGVLIAQHFHSPV